MSKTGGMITAPPAAAGSGDGADLILARPPAPGPWRVMVRKFRRNRVAMTGLMVLLLLYGSALFAGFLGPYSYSASNRTFNYHPPMLGQIHLRDGAGQWTRPYVCAIAWSAADGAVSYGEDCSKRRPIRLLVRGESYRLLFWRSNLHLFGVEGDGRLFLLGTDYAGRDLLSRLLSAAQISLTVGLLGISISIPLGLMVGGIAGYFGGKADFVLMRLVETILAVPSLYLILTIRYSFGGLKSGQMSSTTTYLVMVAILAFVGWAGLGRVVRGMVLSIREREFVTAARALGKSNLGIIVQHVLPGTLSFVIVSATLSIPGYILAEVALSYLGVGIHEPDASWGNMLNEAANASVLAAHPWILLPGVCIFLTVLAFNFVGDGLRDAADPRMLSRR